MVNYKFGDEFYIHQKFTNKKKNCCNGVENSNYKTILKCNSLDDEANVSSYLRLPVQTDRYH
jgi:hypothetical protein